MSLFVPRKTWPAAFSRELQRCLRAERMDSDVLQAVARAVDGASVQSTLDEEANYRAIEVWARSVGISLVAGVGIILDEQADGSIVINATSTEPPRAGSLFLPRTADWPLLRMRMPSGQSFLRFAEALIAGTPPASGTDSSNCRAIRIAGTSGGQQDVRLHTPGGREFRWDGNDTAVLGEQATQNTADVAERGFASLFQATADLRVTTVGMAGRNFDSFLTAGKGKVYEILDEGRTQVLASSAPFTDETGTDALVSKPLASAVNLAQGQRYWLAVRILDGGEQRGQWRGSSGSGSWSGSIVRPSTVSYPTRVLALSRTDTGDWINPSEPLGDRTTNNPGGMRKQLAGSPGGVLLTGDMQVSIVSFGTPPSDPTEINLRLVWTEDTT